jgi:hypothetical protein
MANLFKLESGKLFSVIGKLAQSGFTAEMAEVADTNPDIVRVMVNAAQKFIEEAERNPFVQTVSEQIETLKAAIREEGWNVPVETIARLAETAPAWPKGRDSYRSFRIRFGEGDDGVVKTFEAHVARIKRVYGDVKDRRRWNQLRLLSGNMSHKPIIEWAIVHLDANRKRKSIEAVRGSKSLADEGLVLAWLFPKRARTIDYDKWSAWLCAGYELNLSEHDESWRCVPGVFFGGDDRWVELGACWCEDDASDIAVPALQE